MNRLAVETPTLCAPASTPAAAVRDLSWLVLGITADTEALAGASGGWHAPGETA